MAATLICGAGHANKRPLEALDDPNTFVVFGSGRGEVGTGGAL
mgnify:CR=1 FL=1